MGNHNFVSKAAYDSGALAERAAVLKQLRAALADAEQNYNQPVDSWGLRVAIDLVQARNEGTSQ